MASHDEEPMNNPGLGLKNKPAMHFRLNLLFFLLLSVRFLTAQVDPAALDRYFEQARRDWEVPGMAIAVVKDGKVVLAEGYGALAVNDPQKVDENTVFAIASNTKAFIAAAVGMLVEAGKLNWDDPVEQHLPYFELYNPYVTAKTTVRDLLCHRVGLGTFSGDVIWYKSEHSAAEVVRRAREVPQAFDFRAGYGYSNLMFITAGEVIRAVAGQPWDVFIQNNILRPLEMDRTFTSVTQLEGQTNVATPHKPTQTGNTPIPYANWDNMGAAGGILSTAGDMAHWLKLQLDGGRWKDDRLFTTETQSEWWQPHNPRRISAAAREYYPQRNFSAYGLGWGLSDWDGRLVAAHGGGYDGMYSQVMLVPGEKLGVVVLTNSMKGIGNALARYVVDRYLDRPERDWSAEGLERYQNYRQYRDNRVQERLDHRQTETQPSLPLSQYAGEYHDPMYGDIKVKMEKGELRLLFPHAPALDATLTHWHYNTFQINWDETHAWFDFGTVNFQLDNQGKIMELQFDVPNDDIFFHELHPKRVDN